MFRFTSVRVPALTAAVLFAATAAVDIPHDQPSHFRTPADYVLELLFAVALSAAAIACQAWACQDGCQDGCRTGRATRVAVGTAAGGFVLLSASAWSTAARGQDSLGPVFLLGLLALVGSAVALLVLDLRRRVAPRFAGITFALATVGMIALGDGYGVLAWTAGWVAIAALSQAGTRERTSATV
jgi:hypothetical protein